MSTLPLLSARSRPAKRHDYESENIYQKRRVDESFLEIEMQTTSGASSAAAFMRREISTDDFTDGESMTISMLNDENADEALASNHSFLVTETRDVDGKLLVSTTTHVSPAHDAEAETQSTMLRCNPLHPQPAAENPHQDQEQELPGSAGPHPQPATHGSTPVLLEDELLTQLLLEHPILEQEFSRRKFDEIEFDPVRPCRGAPLSRGALPPPPRRFHSFWWRDVARAAYDAERAARLRRAREGGAVAPKSTPMEV